MSAPFCKRLDFCQCSLSRYVTCGPSSKRVLTQPLEKKRALREWNCYETSVSNNLPSSEVGPSLAVMVQESLQRLGSQSAACKWGSVLLGAAALVGCRLGGENLLWLAAPGLLLALADAGYAAQARRIAEFAGRALNGSNKDPGRAGELIR